MFVFCCVDCYGFLVFFVVYWMTKTAALQTGVGIATFDNIALLIKLAVQIANFKK